MPTPRPRGAAVVTARRRGGTDPALSARVESRVPLRYAAGADALADRPAHVRAGSSLARVAGGIAVVQDDANFIAVVDPDGRHARAIALPAGAGGRRQFDDGRGNKAHKLDLEACVVVHAGGGPLLVAFGSGSTAARESVALVDGWATPSPRVAVVHVPALYAALRAEAAFAGSELNVEGAAVVGEWVRLFARGNGAPRGDLAPANATCDLDLLALVAHLRAPAAHRPPAPAHVVRYDLGALGGVPVTFTDAAAVGDVVLFTGAAEASPDATRDGPVAGSVVGVIDAAGGARWAALTDERGAPFAAKVEGLVVADGAERRLLVVVDVDDPDVPSELCAVALAGPWGW